VQICDDLITPTLWRVGDLWATGEISVTVEHFASNYFREVLSDRFHAAPKSASPALVMVSCAPGEAHEIPALMLALALRLQNIRVAYLGQSIESNGLLHAIQQLRPRLVCASLTLPAHLGNLITLAQQLQKLPTPRPRFIFGGQAFLAYPHIIEEIPGTYLHGKIGEIVKQIQALYAEELT
jgi:methanogenic corrinoid protein MtbC1